MDIKLLKSPDESKLAYIRRIVYGKLVDKTIDSDYSELAPLVFEKEYSSDVARRMFYGVRALLDVIGEEEFNNVSEDEIIKEIEEKKKELEKEKVKFQDQKREYRALLRTDARFEHMVDEMLKSIESLNVTKPLINEYCGIDDSLDREAVLLASDWHFGIEEENYWNKINVEIAKQRVNKLKDKVIYYCTMNKVNTLHIELLGDMVNGLLHFGTRVSNEEDVINQTMMVSEVIGEMVNDMAKHIPNIKLYTATGNHGRCSSNIKESIDTENFERLTPWYLKGRLKSNVEIVENVYEHDIIIFKFLNETVFGVHGHNDKVKSAVDDLSDMFKIFPTEVHMGHYHAFQEFDSHSMTTTVNGTLSGVDKYAKSIRKTSTPMQTLMIYNEEGREATYKIKLK